MSGMGNSAYLMKLVQSLVALARLVMESGDAAIEKAEAKFLVRAAGLRFVDIATPAQAVMLIREHIA